MYQEAAAPAAEEPPAEVDSAVEDVVPEEEADAGQPANEETAAAEADSPETSGADEEAAAGGGDGEEVPVEQAVPVAEPVQQGALCIVERS